MAFPVGVSPAPVAPWHIWHFALYVASPPDCAARRRQTVRSTFLPALTQTQFELG
jgi:hypothetical protein